MANDNMRIWNALKTTDPAHTKAFTRSGGFKGTAIKPIYSVEKMTALFGPCGVGWGVERPHFDVQTVGDERLVYCTAGVWYINPDDTEKDAYGYPIQRTAYGVGGDFVAKKGNSGLRLDDEAFKKAFTDAVSNAMKYIGVGADVHMGQFDDSKYVQEASATAAMVTASATADKTKADLEADKATMRKVLDDLSTATTLEEFEKLRQGWKMAVGAIHARNPGVVTKAKGEIDKLRLALEPVAVEA